MKIENCLSQLCNLSNKDLRRKNENYEMHSAKLALTLNRHDSPNSKLSYVTL
jgi:hypothetical protein